MRSVVPIKDYNTMMTFTHANLRFLVIESILYCRPIENETFGFQQIVYIMCNCRGNRQKPSNNRRDIASFFFFAKYFGIS